MRITLLVLLAIIALFLLLEAFTAVSTARTAHQPYAVIERHGALEVRHYPQAVLASVGSPASGYGNASNQSFRRLADYIYGGNATGTSIPMTAPVHMQMGPAGSRMSFVMPGAFTVDSMPAPKDPAIAIESFPDCHMATLRFGGFADGAAMRAHAAMLLEACATHGLQPAGPVRFLGYDPPWQVMGRRNEVAVPVRWPR